jgi:TnpA family transposase
MAGVGRLLVGPGALPRAQKISRRAYWSHAGLNKGEASNSVRRAVFFHHQGEIRDRPDQQDIQIIR